MPVNILSRLITDLTNPYFRFYSEIERRNDIPCACISFLTSRYINNPFVNDSFKLSPELKQALVDFLTAPYDEIYNCTRWEYMLAKYNWENIVIVNWHICDWLQLTSEKKKKIKNVPSRMQYALPCDLPMPNYLQLQ